MVEIDRYPLRQRLSHLRLQKAASRLFGLITEERDRWILWLPVFLGIGAATYFALRWEPSFWPGGMSLAFATAGIWFFRRIAPVAILCIALLSMCLGYIVAQTRAHFVAAPVLEKAYGPAKVIGRVVRVERLPGRPRVLLDQIELRRISPAAMPKYIRVRLHPEDTPNIGDRLDLFAKLSPPGAPVLPGGYDFQRRAWFDQIGAIGFSLGRARLVSAADAGTFTLSLSRMRQSLSDRIRAALPAASGAIAAALITGDRSAIPQSALDDMRDAGLAHLLAISGLHVGLVAMILFVTIRQTFAAIEPLALRYPIKKYAAVAAFAGAFFYLVLTGATVPTQRAFVMAGLALLAIVLDRDPFSPRLVAFGAFAVLLIAPESILGASFQMSFAAVVALIAVYEALGDRYRQWWQGSSLFRRIVFYFLGVILTTIVAGIVTGVFAAYHFGRFANYGLPANFIAVPLTAFWVMPWAVVSVLLMPLGLESWGLLPMGWGIEVILSVARTVAGWSGAIWYVASGPVTAIALITLGGLWLCLWRRRWRLYGLAGIAAGLAFWYAHDLPDVYIASDGRIAAVRGDEGALYVSHKTRGRFTQKQWRTANGNNEIRHWRDLAAAGCDRLGCTAEIKGRKVAYVADGRALADECRYADIVVSAIPVRQECPSAKVVLDRFDVWRHGAAAVFLSPSQIRVETVAQDRGHRLWTGPCRSAKGANSCE